MGISYWYRQRTAATNLKHIQTLLLVSPQSTPVSQRHRYCDPCTGRRQLLPLVQGLGSQGSAEGSVV